MNTRIFVGNLAPATTAKLLRAFMKSEGVIVRSVELVLDKATGRSRGFAFVDFDSPGEAEEAIEKLNGKELKGRALGVKLATDEGAEGAKSAAGRGGAARRSGRAAESRLQGGNSHGKGFPGLGGRRGGGSSSGPR